MLVAHTQKASTRVRQTVVKRLVYQWRKKPILQLSLVPSAFPKKKQAQKTFRILSDLILSNRPSTDLSALAPFFAPRWAYHQHLNQNLPCKEYRRCLARVSLTSDTYAPLQ